MTDVAGPPLVPPVRVSSLPIRGADAGAAGAGGSNLEVDCSMAQAFEIPTENWTATGRCSPAGAIQRVPGHLSRSPLPAGPTPSIGQLRIWVQHPLAKGPNGPPERPVAEPDSRFSDLPKVNRSGPI